MILNSYPPIKQPRGFVNPGLTLGIIVIRGDPSHYCQLKWRCSARFNPAFRTARFSNVLNEGVVLLNVVAVACCSHR